MKPGVSRARTGVWPSAAPKSTSRCSTAGAVSSPAMTSTSFISGTGLKKCSPATRSGRAQALAMAVTGSDDVLVARMHVSPTAASSSLNSACLASSFSTMASTTIVHPDSPASVSGRAIRATARWASSAWNPALGGKPVEHVRDGAACVGRCAGPRIDQTHLEARLRGDLRDAASHESGADDADHVGAGLRG